MRISTHSNIYYLYLIKLSKWFMVIMPVVALFYAENGLDEFDIYLLQAIYSLGVAVMEIPSGYMADVIGRKTSLVLGSILGTLGFVIYTVSTDFGHFLSAEIVLGLGASFISGSDSALLYDSLAEAENQQLYLRYEGRITALGNLAETTAAICGGVIAALIGYRAVYLCQAIIAAVAIPASLLLVEPRQETARRNPSFTEVIAICRHALIENLRLSSAILLSAVTGTATLCMAWTCQVYFIANGLDEATITPLWVILNLTVAIASAASQRIVSFLGMRQAIGLIILFVPASYLLLGLTPLISGLITLCLFYMIRGYATPLLKDLTNHYCSSANRATVLSIRSLIIRLGFAILGPFIGLISRHFNLAIALVLAGTILLGLAIGAGLFCRRTAPDIFSQHTRQKEG
ncbi:MAG: MFS transporter [Desulfopila sp.]